ncbi:MAG: ParB/RepB/Spo0J family partition protein [Acidobacteriota bacterium]|nr:ParB/RepB/Spo0J family partition protein [Acidobacteriota bacterium]
MNKEPDRSQRKALGKGLSALLPSRVSPVESKPPERTAAEAGTAAVTQRLPEHFEEFASIPLDRIQPGEKQPRDAFDAEKLAELSASIRAHGIIQPITVFREGKERYRIIAGERRWRAAALAGLKEIPSLIRSAERDELLELALIENIQREDLNPIEIATAFQRLSSDLHLSHEQIAERTGKDRSTVTNFLRLLRLAPPVRHALIAGEITMGHARALLNLDSDHQSLLCSDIRNRQLSVRETEKLVRQITDPTKEAGSHKSTVDNRFADPNIRAALEEMSMALGTKVRLLTRNGRSGRLEIEYYSQEDLDRIYSVIVK